MDSYCSLFLTLELYLQCLDGIVAQIGMCSQSRFPHLHPPVFVALFGINACVLYDESTHGTFVQTVMVVMVFVIKLPIGEHDFPNTRFDKGNVTVCLNFRHAHVNEIGRAHV